MKQRNLYQCYLYLELNCRFAHWSHSRIHCTCASEPWLLILGVAKEYIIRPIGTVSNDLWSNYWKKLL